MSTSNTDLDARGVVIACPQCGKHNRLPYERLGQPARCASCGGALALPSEPVNVPTEEAFQALTTRAAVPVLVDFWADWCGPCKMMAPEFARAAQAAGGRWLAAKVDTEALPQVAQRVGITGIPLLAVYKGGREAAREAGARPAAAIRAFVAPHI